MNSDRPNLSESQHGDKTSPPRRVIGYYAGWTQASKNYSPADIPAEHLTHINYAFGVIDEDGRAMLRNAEVDTGSGARGGELGGNFQQLRELKERYPHLRTMISIGGWTDSGRFSDAVVTDEKRRDFVSSCIELFLTRWPGVFDGIDIDWEYPVCCGLPENSYRPEDRRNCTLLFEELRRQLDELEIITGKRYLLTAAIPAGRALPEKCFDLRSAAAILDWINVMTYDMNGAGESGITNFNAAFRPSSGDPRSDNVRNDWSVVGSVRAFEDLGVPRDQIVVGVPFYGRGFTGVPDVNDGLYQSFSETISADYRTVKSDYLNRPGFRHLRHSEAEAPWLYDPGSGTMLSYDDPVSLGRKTDFVREQGLGGVMFWELSDDDAEASLLRAISARLQP